jgi:hypothetical protein
MNPLQFQSLVVVLVHCGRSLERLGGGEMAFRSPPSPTRPKGPYSKAATIESAFLSIPTFWGLVFTRAPNRLRQVLVLV